MKDKQILPPAKQTIRENNICQVHAFKIISKKTVQSTLTARANTQEFPQELLSARQKYMMASVLRNSKLRLSKSNRMPT